MKKMRSAAVISALAALICVTSASVSAQAASVIDFENGDCSFASMKTDDGGDKSELYVTEWGGSKQLKINVSDCANVPKVLFDINSMISPDDFDRVKIIEMDITIESKDGTTPPGWAGGAIGTQGGDNSPGWAQSDWETGEYNNAVSETVTIQRKFLLPAEKFVNGTEDTKMILMRWGCDVDYNMYVDNIRFLDENNSAIEIISGSSDNSDETSQTEESAAEETAAVTAETEDTAPDIQPAQESPAADNSTQSATTGNVSAFAAASLLVISSYAVIMTRRKK